MPRRSTCGPASRNFAGSQRLAEVRGLDDVVVDADDLGQLGHSMRAIPTDWALRSAPSGRECWPWRREARTIPGSIRPRSRDTANWPAAAAWAGSRCSLVARATLAYLFPAAMCFALLAAVQPAHRDRRRDACAASGLRPVVLDLTTAEVVATGTVVVARAVLLAAAAVATPRRRRPPALPRSRGSGTRVTRLAPVDRDGDCGRAALVDSPPRGAALLGRRRSLSRRAARVARRDLARARAAARPRRLGRAPQVGHRLAAPAVRRRLRGLALAEGVRRPRRVADRAADLLRGDRAGRARRTSA